MDRSLSSVAARAAVSSCASADSSESPVSCSSTNLVRAAPAAAVAVAHRSSPSGALRLAAIEPVRHRAREQLHDRDHARVFAACRPDDPEHSRQCLSRSVRGQDGRQPRIDDVGVFGPQDDARSGRVEIPGNQVEHPRLLLESMEDALEGEDVGELGLLEQSRGPVEKEAVFGVLLLQGSPRQLSGAAEDAAGLLALPLDRGDQPPTHLVQGQAAELAREALRQRVELRGRVGDVGIEHARDHDVGLVDLDDEDLARRHSQEAQALDHGVQSVRGHDESDLARELGQQARGGREQAADVPFGRVEVRIDLLADVVGDAPLAHQLVDVQAVGAIRRDAAGGSVGLNEVAAIGQVGHDVADRGRREGEAVRFEQRPGRHGPAGVHVDTNDLLQNRPTPDVETRHIAVSPREC